MVNEASDGERGRPILELSGIGKTFGGVTALTGVVDWEQVVRLQGELLRASVERSARLARRHLEVAQAVIAARGAVSDAELAAFRQAGFDDQAALEVVLGVSLATLCNFANNLGQPELNPQLAAYEWKGAAPAAAAE